MCAEVEFSYSTSKPVSELSQVEALALVNRWAKLKDRFYYASKTG